MTRSSRWCVAAAAAAILLSATPLGASECGGEFTDHHHEEWRLKIVSIEVDGADYEIPEAYRRVVATVEARSSDRSPAWHAVQADAVVFGAYIPLQDGELVLESLSERYEVHEWVDDGVGGAGGAASALAGVGGVSP